MYHVLSQGGALRSKFEDKLMCREKDCLQGLFVWVFLILKAPHMQQKGECVTGWCRGQNDTQNLCHKILCAQECVLDVHRELTVTVCLGPHALLWAGTENGT